VRDQRDQAQQNQTNKKGNSTKEPRVKRQQLRNGRNDYYFTMVLRGYWPLLNKTMRGISRIISVTHPTAVHAKYHLSSIPSRDNHPSPFIHCDVNRIFFWSSPLSVVVAVFFVFRRNRRSRHSENKINDIRNLSPL
jgi:hypothetical protein